MATASEQMVSARQVAEQLNVAPKTPVNGVRRQDPAIELRNGKWHFRLSPIAAWLREWETAAK